MRKVAATELGELGDTRAVPVLINWLNSSDAGFRKVVTQALRKLAPESVAALIQSLLSDTKCYAISEVAETLGELGDPQAVEPLIRIVSYRSSFSWHSPALRLASVKALGKLGDLRAVEPLIRSLADDDGNVRRAAAEALASLGEPKWQQAIRGQEDDYEGLVRVAAPDVEALIKAIRNTDYHSTYCVKVISKLSEPHTVALLIEAVHYSRSSEVQAAAASALGDLGDARAVEPLIQAFVHFGEWGAMGAIAEALGKLGDSRAVEPLIGDYSLHNNWSGINRVVEALGKIGDPRAIEPLIQVMERAEIDGSTIIDALVKLGSRSVEPLVRSLQNDDSWRRERERAATALGKLGGPRAVEALTRALQDKDMPVRRSAANALGITANLG